MNFLVKRSFFSVNSMNSINLKNDVAKIQSVTELKLLNQILIPLENIFRRENL